MKPPLFFILLAVACTCSADTLRLSAVQNAAGDDAEKMTQTSPDGEKVFFVKKQAIIGDADVEEAHPSLETEAAIDVTLTEAGGKKMKEATRVMRAGEDRLAIIVEGRLDSAPVLNQVPLGRTFVIEGLRDLDAKGLDDLARKMSGRPPRAEGESPAPIPQIPKIKTVPYTEDEYRQIKAAREKMGIYYIDSAPTDEELNQTLHKGMSCEEVIKVYGHPYNKLDTPDSKDLHLFYELAPEKRPVAPTRNMYPSGFNVFLKDGKAECWSHSNSNASRKEKVVGAEKSTLIATLPKVDTASGHFDPVAFVEGITVPNPKQDLNHTDLSDLLSVVVMLASYSTVPPADKNATLNANCDFIKTLATISLKSPPSGKRRLTARSRLKI